MLDAGANTKHASAEYDGKEEMNVIRLANIAVLLSKFQMSRNTGFLVSFHSR